jgi:hypothetical protein
MALAMLAMRVATTIAIRILMFAQRGEVVEQVADSWSLKGLVQDDISKEPDESVEFRRCNGI